METVGTAAASAESIPCETAPFSSLSVTLGRDYRIQSYSGRSNVLNDMAHNLASIPSPTENSLVSYHFEENTSQAGQQEAAYYCRRPQSNGDRHE